MLRKLLHLLKPIIISWSHAEPIRLQHIIIQSLSSYQFALHHNNCHFESINLYKLYREVTKLVCIGLQWRSTGLSHTRVRCHDFVIVETQKSFMGQIIIPTLLRVQEIQSYMLYTNILTAKFNKLNKKSGEKMPRQTEFDLMKA